VGAELRVSLTTSGARERTAPRCQPLTMFVQYGRLLEALVSDGRFPSGDCRVTRYR
jgi:hypothetical protein